MFLVMRPTWSFPKPEGKTIHHGSNVTSAHDLPYHQELHPVVLLGTSKIFSAAESRIIKHLILDAIDLMAITYRHMKHLNSGPAICRDGGEK